MNTETQEDIGPFMSYYLTQQRTGIQQRRIINTMKSSDNSENKTPPSDLSSLVARLYEHAYSHEHVAWADDDQKQWMLDLRDAASRLEKINHEPK
jgi:hypothetical protein